jgi:RNA polymerase sigma-70 factor (family 1)
MNKRIQFSDQEALNALSTGEVAMAKIAFKHLYDQHFTTIYRVALRLLESSDLAKDMAQELFTNLWIKRGDLVGVKSFEAYARTSVKNLAYDFFKKQVKSEAANGEYISRMEVNDETFNTKRYNGVLKLLEELPPKPRQVFELAKVEGLSYEAIAERLKISPVTVNHHMSTALKFIRKRKYKVTALAT